MDNNNNPLQPTPGSLPQPTAYAEAMNSATDVNQGQPQVSSVQPVAGPPRPSANTPTTNAGQQGLSPASGVPQQRSALVATDTDDISLQWIHMVEGLKRQHAQDPRKFAREFEKLKAQYITSRYGKEVRQTEDEA